MKFTLTAGVVVTAMLAISMAWAQETAPRHDVLSDQRAQVKAESQQKQHGYTHAMRAKSYYREKMATYHQAKIKQAKDAQSKKSALLRTHSGQTQAKSLTSPHRLLVARRKKADRLRKAKLEQHGLATTPTKSKK